MTDCRNRCRSTWHRTQLIALCLTCALIVVGCSSIQAEKSVDSARVEVAPTAEAQTVPTSSPTEPSLLMTVEPGPDSVVPVLYGYEIVETFPHDPTAFTQGLVYGDGIFYEGTGLYNQSTLRHVEPSSGEVLSGVRLADELFGEGITVLDDKIYQLTWKAQTGFVVDKETFELIDTFTYPTEGWGLTHDGEQLIMSDGTDALIFLDPDRLEETGRVQVYDNQGPVIRLNELEYIDGEIYANVWQTDRIARIDPADGQVTGWIDLSGLLSPEDREQPVDVLNGIAYDDETDRLFVTGKLWPKLFEIRLIEMDE